MDADKTSSLEVNSLTLYRPSDPQVRREDALIWHTLATSQRILVVTGAGISASAGNTFSNKDGLLAQLGGRRLFEWAVYNNAADLDKLYRFISTAVPAIRAAQPTPFHLMMGRLAEQGRLLRHYTQNIDGMHNKVPGLECSVPLPTQAPFPQTVPMHGSLLHTVCNMAAAHVRPLDVASFADSTVMVECQDCRDEAAARQSSGLRARTIGFLCPRFHFYNHPGWEQEKVATVIKEDLRCRPDALLVVGTSLAVPSTKNLVLDAANTVHKDRHGLCVYVNLVAPTPSPPVPSSLFDLIVTGASDDFAATYVF